MAERLLFNPQNLSSEAELVTTLADSAIEGRANAPIHERINPIEIRFNGSKVVNPQLDPSKDITEYIVWSTELEHSESLTALKIREALANGKSSSLAISFSPTNLKYNYTEGRITVYYKTTDQNGENPHFESYGIPTDNLSPKDMLLSAWRLTEWSESNPSLENPEDLRANPVVLSLPEGENPWVFLSHYINIPKVWQAILDGDPKRQQEEIRKITMAAAKDLMPLIGKNLTPQEQVGLNRRALRLLEAKGAKIDQTKLGCEVSLSDNLFDSWTYTEFDSQGNILGNISSNSKEKFIKNCGNCGAEINKKMKKGDTCAHCNGTYQGC